MRELARQLIDEHQHRRLLPSAPRLASHCTALPEPKQGILALTGMGGSGKTTLLLDHAAQLVSSGTPRERTLYADLADPRVLCASRKESPLPTLIDAFMERFPENRRAKTHLFLDNPGHIPNWQSFLKSLVDAYGMRITVADARRSWLDNANSSGTNQGIVVYEVLPAGLSDLIVASNSAEPLDRAAKHQSFLHTGGLPAARTSDSPIATLQGTARNALSDIALRYSTNVPLDNLTAFFSYALGKTGRTLSLTKAQKELGEAGFRTTRSSLKNYLDSLEEAHLLYTLEDLRFAGADNPRSPRTVIAADHGMALSLNPLASMDTDALAMTLCYLDLRRKGHLGSVFTYRPKAGGPTMLACANPDSGNIFSLVGFATSDGNPKKEKAALQAISEAQRQTHARKATLLVKDEPTEHLKAQTSAIAITTLREWLLLDSHL